MTSFADALDVAAVAELLSMASAIAGGQAIALVDLEGRVLAGPDPRGDGTRSRPINGEAGTVALVVGTRAVQPELLELVGRGFELLIESVERRASLARVAHEMAVGRQIQMALVPRRFPDIDGWSMAAAYEPALEVGGDLYDAFRVRGEPGQLGLIVADVTGKGIPAALLMADVRAVLHAATDSSRGPADALGRVNRILVDERATALMVTAVLLVLDTASGVVRYSGAGHEPALVARAAGGIEPFEACGVILGLSGRSEYLEQETRLLPGDALVLYTDGITDARDGDRRFYGEERLRDVVLGACGRTADEIARAITDDVHAFRGDAEPFDDLTLLVVERARTAGRGAHAGNRQRGG
jgi:serine phosphatase RsbU (regulator of sigma subunit)